MSGLAVGVISLLLILGLIYLGMQVAIVLALVSFIGVWIIRGDVHVAVDLLALTAADGISSYSFGVVPLFVLMGICVSHAGIGKDLFAVTNYLFRRIHGGLGVATVAANAVFAAITGISIASAAIFTRIAVPEMLRLGYQPRFAVGVVAGSSVLGMLIPPSVLLIVYALVTEQSVADMFIAGIIPGILLTLVYIITIVLTARLSPERVYTGVRDEQVKAGELTVREIILRLLPSVALVILVLGGIYGGVFTPTEAGAMGALASLLLLLIKGRLTIKVLKQIFLETGHITASILFLIIAASMYSRMLAVTGVPAQLGVWLAGMKVGFPLLLFFYVILMVLLGTILDSTSIILVLVPLFLPVIIPFKVSLVWFGIITIIGAEIGLLTPPLGIACYVIKGSLADTAISLGDIFRGALPFAVLMLIVLMILIKYPVLTTALL